MGHSQIKLGMSAAVFRVDRTEAVSARSMSRSAILIGEGQFDPD